MDGLTWPNPNTLTVVGLLLFIILAGAKGVWVFGWQHRKAAEDFEARLAKKQAEVDQWRHLALAQLGVMEETVEKATRLIVTAKQATERASDEAPA